MKVSIHSALESSMPSSLHHDTQIMGVLGKKLVGWATMCLGCFFCTLAYASAQSQTPQTRPQMPHYRSYSSTHYRSTTHLHSVDQKPHSVPAVVPDITGKSSAKGAVSPNKELDQLERASVVKPMSAKPAALPSPTKHTVSPEKHSAPINFSHKELPQSPRSGAAKIH